MPFEDTTILKYLSTALDIAIVWFIIYKLILIIRGTKAVQLLKGITVIIVVKMISIFLELRTLSWLTEQVLTWGFLAVIIIFQPELRRALEQLGRGSLFSRVGTHEDDEPEMVATAIAKATEYMGKRRIGALITLSKETVWVIMWKRVFRLMQTYHRNYLLIFLFQIHLFMTER